MPTAQTIDLPFVLQALARYRKRAALFLLAGLALAVLGILVAPRQYASEARLFLRVGRESVALDPTVTTGQVIGLNETRQSEINSALDLLHSRGLREMVVDRLGPEVFLDPATGPVRPGEPIQASAAGTSAEPRASWGRALMGSLEKIGLLDPVDRREKAVRELARAMQASIPRNTHVVAVTCKSDTPERAQRIVQAIVDCFSESHMRANRAPRSLDFFTEQTAALRRRLDQTADELQRRKNEVGLLSIDGQRNLVDQRRGAVAQELAAADAQLAASRAKLRTLMESIQSLPAREVTEQVEGIANAAADNMRQTLYQLEIREQELASQLTPEHPSLVAVRQQLAEVRAILAEQAESRTQVTTNLSPTHQPLHLAALVESAEAQAWQARLASLQAEQVRLNQEVEQLNRSEIEIAALERDLDLLQFDYRSYAERREQSRIDQVLAEERISNINVVQAPTLVRKPVSPRKLVTLFVGLMASATGALCVAVLSARFDPSLVMAENPAPDQQLSERASVPRWQQDTNGFAAASTEERHDRTGQH